jgi:hypothetical protein
MHRPSAASTETETAPTELDSAGTASSASKAGCPGYHTGHHRPHAATNHNNRGGRQRHCTDCTRSLPSKQGRACRCSTKIILQSNCWYKACGQQTAARAKVPYTVKAWRHTPEGGTPRQKQQSQPTFAAAGTTTWLKPPRKTPHSNSALCSMLGWGGRPIAADDSGHAPALSSSLLLLQSSQGPRSQAAHFKTTKNEGTSRGQLSAWPHQPQQAAHDDATRRCVTCSRCSAQGAFQAGELPYIPNVPTNERCDGPLL